MTLTEADLRNLIRDAVARHLGRTAASDETGAADAGSVRPAAHEPGLHPSQAIYLTITNPGEACIIEPGVGCNHCGYCKTYGF
ncbi:MAG TPA: hypothetical protein VMM93_13495 [Vicinamibacterales bacterium]|nr:hypothetical protein [Vicinamibacterales bacterium]